MELLDTPSRIRKILPNQERARIAIFLIVLILTFRVLSLILNSLELHSQTDYYFERTSEIAGLDQLEFLTTLCSALTALSRFVSMVTFILWFYRAYCNLSIKSTALNDNPAAVVYSWFIPIINLTRPFFMMKEMYLGTIETLERHHLQTPIKLSVDKVYWWWTFWNISNVVSILIVYIPIDSDGIYFLREKLKWELISLTIHVILGVITIQMIRDYSKIEPLLQDVPDVVQIESTSHTEL